uniref:Glycine--tRNA ligase beta subunit n=1 Tax=candidate division WOR-3 bacterium TaxID=2052148 RepID=A0A7V3V0M0_UNCW3
MPVLLLEIGTEELPPGIIESTALELNQRLHILLKENSIEFGNSDLFWTPRRLAIRINKLSPEKPGIEVEIQGPPQKSAYDTLGNPTPTAIGFARSHNKSVNDLYVKTTKRGNYIFIRKTLPPVPTPEILANHLPQILGTLPFPKSMRWDETGMRFSRPIRWVVCLWDSQVIPFQFGKLTAGRHTFGHRNFTPAPIELTNPTDYETTLLTHRVIASPQKRNEFVIRQLQTLAATVNGKPVPDEDLLKETVSITEYPEPILGCFHQEFLNLPRPVLITALRMHQRCFSVQNEKEQLLPYFIAVANTPDCDEKQVRRWYEKAIESRLKDARFFVETDLKIGLEPLVEEEKKVTWIEGLGSYYDKTIRLRKICRYLADQIPGINPNLLDRAAYLCKADLLTNLVREKEFTALQGIIGGIYAQQLGENEMVAEAISEHYLPRSTDDPLPLTPAGALLSIADKIDNICATYLTGNIPTGSEDPFGVRRQATGILLIILNNHWPIAIDELVQTALKQFPENIVALPIQMILTLFQERLTALFTEMNIRYDVTNAVLKTVWHTPTEALLRARSLQQFRASPEFEKLIIGQKRVANILRAQSVAGMPEEHLLTEPAEKDLFNKASALEPELNQLIKNQQYRDALHLLLSLRPAIDRLFDDVLIMCPDPLLRTNRLKLLHYLWALFARIADFSEIVLDGTSLPSSDV